MLKHQVAPYKVWYMLGFDVGEMGDLFDATPNNRPFVGKTIYAEDKGWVGIVLNQKIDSGPQLISVLAHELMHVVSYISHHVRFWPETVDDMEPWCYLHENLMEVSLGWMGYE